jgi:beta-glucosidase
LLGNYNGDPSSPVTILQGIKNRAPEGTEIRFAKGVDLIEKGTVYQVVEASYLKPAGDRFGKGLWDEYFDNPDLKGKPVFAKIDSTGRLYWGVDTPGEGIPKDHFSVRRTGYLIPDQDGTYELGLIADDKCRLYLDGNLEIDNWSPFEMNKMKSFKTELKAGTAYKIRIEYADETEYAGVRFMWRKMIGVQQNDLLIKEAVKLAANSDVAIVVAGISPRLEGEEMPVKIDGFYGGDRTNMKIPAGMSKLISEVYKTGKPVILVLTSGSALAINWEKENIPAILQAWYSGQEGGNAVADILFGNYNPAGRLPVTYYKSVNDLPPFRNYDMEGRTYKYFRGEPLFPFGFGLSYTDFKYKNASIIDNHMSSGDTIRIKLEIENYGKMGGDEVVQIYIRSMNPGNESANKKLVAFKRVYINTGDSKKLRINIPVSELAGYDSKTREMKAIPGSYSLEIGASSLDIRAELELFIE